MEYYLSMYASLTGVLFFRVPLMVYFLIHVYRRHRPPKNMDDEFVKFLYSCAKKTLHRVRLDRRVCFYFLSFSRWFFLFLVSFSFDFYLLEFRIIVLSGPLFGWGLGVMGGSTEERKAFCAKLPFWKKTRETREKDWKITTWTTSSWTTRTFSYQWPTVPS